MSWSVFEPVGNHITIADLSEVVEVTVPATCNGVVVQAFDENVRFTAASGSTPDADTGFQIVAGDPERTLPFPPGTVLKFIEETAGASLQYQSVRAYSQYIY